MDKKRFVIILCLFFVAIIFVFAGSSNTTKGVFLTCYDGSSAVYFTNTSSRDVVITFTIYYNDGTRPYTDTFTAWKGVTNGLVVGHHNLNGIRSITVR